MPAACMRGATMPADDDVPLLLRLEDDVPRGWSYAGFAAVVAYCEAVALIEIFRDPFGMGQPVPFYLATAAFMAARLAAWQALRHGACDHGFLAALLTCLIYMLIVGARFALLLFMTDADRASIGLAIVSGLA